MKKGGCTPLKHQSIINWMAARWAGDWWRALQWAAQPVGHAAQEKN